MHRDSTLYFAYGSNMNVEQMRSRCPGASLLGSITIHHWRRVEREFADIEPCWNADVHGVLWACKPQDMANLDSYEGWPRFYEKAMVAWDRMRSMPIIAYMMTHRAAQIRDGIPYSDAYRRVCLIGASENGIVEEDFR